ncbi:MAG: hypothetical protein VB130_04490 [Clostridium sp.]|nr:hypothetical protein [Clostridium sp.]
MDNSEYVSDLDKQGQNNNFRGFKNNIKSLIMHVKGKILITGATGFKIT